MTTTTKGTNLHNAVFSIQILKENPNNCNFEQTY